MSSIPTPSPYMGVVTDAYQGVEAIKGGPILCSTCPLNMPRVSSWRKAPFYIADNLQRRPSRDRELAVPALSRRRSSRDWKLYDRLLV